MTTKCKKKKRVSKEQLELAKRYRCAYNYIFNKLPPWKKEVIVDNSDNQGDKRVIDEFIKEVRQLAESNRQISDELNND